MISQCTTQTCPEHGSNDETLAQKKAVIIFRWISGSLVAREAQKRWAAARPSEHPFAHKSTAHSLRGG